MKKENKVLNIARKTIDIEMQALANLKPTINDHFLNCLKTIYEAQGRLVVTGIGKSAIIAQKIVATLNSTGTPALFMHAADAIHGDLGMVRPSDVVLCLSKSGETAEIKVLAPLVKNMGNVLIGMTSKRNSFLARQSDFLLLTPIDKEADPNNLAPTASTAAQMAMGDAMAMGLLALRGFTASDFAQYHPGGALGKQLYLKVKDLYLLNEKPEVLVGTSLKEAILEMTAKCLGATAVLDQNDLLKGMLTDGDLRRMLERGENMENLIVDDIMNVSPKTILESELAIRALKVIRNSQVSQLLVVDESGKYKGIIHLHDLIREGLI